MDNFNFFKIFVEGKDDKRFYEDLLDVHFNLKNKRLVVYCEGKDQLLKFDTEFIDAHKETGHSIIIFDADNNPKDREENITQQIEKIEEKYKVKLNYSIFLQPDNKSGALEQILEKIAVEKDLFNCFNRYLDCVKELKGDFRLPELDSRTYAYLNALGLKNKGQTDADYKNKLHWNIKSEYLKPIINFVGAKIRK